MKQSRFTEAQILEILRAHQAGEKVADLLRRHGISENTFYRWKSRYEGLDRSAIQRLHQLEMENRRLKQNFATCGRRNSMISAAVSVSRYSGFGTTQASGRTAHFGCGTAMTTA